jgi:hypothetical protein
VLAACQILVERLRMCHSSATRVIMRNLKGKEPPSPSPTPILFMRILTGVIRE